MKNIILFDSELRNHLLPLTYLRPVSELRVGIMSIHEKWECVFPDARFSHITAEHLVHAFPIEIAKDNLLINSALLPSTELSLLIKALEPNQAILCDDELVAARLNEVQFDKLLNHDALDELDGMMIEPDKLQLLSQLYSILEYGEREILADISRMERKQSVTTAHNPDLGVYTQDQIDLSGVSIDTSDGPVYIAKGATILPGARLKGPIVIGEGSVIKMGAEIYGATCIGPGCTISGEVKNSNIQGFSNKSHQGYLGDSILGQFCNLGALTTVSNLKNSFGPVRQWNYATEAIAEVGVQKFGVVMGDYSRTGILQKINCGTLIGVSSVVMNRDCPKFVPSFSWGVGEEYDYPRALDAAQVLHEFKKKEWDPVLEISFQRVFEISGAYRK